MAISKERLEELIKYEATIWVLDNSNDFEKKVVGLDLSCNCCGIFASIDKCQLDWNNITYDLEELFVTIEEAEFVARNHDTRTSVDEFDPPFVLKEDSEFWFDTGYCNFSRIYRCNVNNLRTYAVENNSTYVTKYFNSYQEAVDYAHKLFKGEE